MSDQGDTTKKPPQQQQQQSQTQLPQQQQISSSSSPHVEESSDQTRPILHHHPHPHHHQLQQPPATPVVASPFIPTPLYVSPGATASSSPFDTASNPKRTRYTGQWKLLPSPSSQQMSLLAASAAPESSPQTQQPRTSAASSSDTASSDPTHSPPVPSSLSPATTGPEGNKSEGEQQQIHHQFRKGKYVSPVWKPHEMLWLARAWRVQYQGGGGPELGGSSAASGRSEHVEGGGGGQGTRGKTRADKDREVAEFLQRHGVNRDAKTAGTKWDNMLGEFRKVYEWERGGERQHVGKSYFRLSPYERKVHRLPASFDEEVFEELSQFMGSRMRTSHARAAAASSSIVAGEDPRPRALPTPPPFKEDELPLSGSQ